MFGVHEDTVKLYWSLFVEYVSDARIMFNHAAQDLEAWQIVAYTFCFACFLMWLRSIFQSEVPLTQRIRKRMFKWIRRIPYVRRQIEKDMAKIGKEIHNDIHKMDAKKEFFKILPDKPMTPEEILNEAVSYEKMGPIPYREGKVSGQVYSDFPPELMKLQTKIFEMFAYSNPLHPDVFPSVRKMEAEVVRMVCNMFNGSNESCGTLTSGGTESILCAMLAYRNWALDRGIERPEAVVPITAHAAFWKAGEYFRIRIRVCPVETDTMQADVWAMSKLINGNTCCLVGSAPQFAHGTIDPLAEISELGVRYNIPVHVDACLGGLLLPNMEALGYNMPQFDFRLPGVTSISCDTHKYGFAPKGSSVVMYRHVSFLHHQYYAYPEWTGGIYATPTLAGSRAGLNSALAWATMLFYGKEGYKECTRKIIETAQNIREGCENIEGLTIFGTSEVSVVAFGSPAFNAYELMDQMHKRGWMLNALQNPPAFHVAVTMFMTQEGLGDQFVTDMKECTAYLLQNPPDSSAVSKTASMYGAAVSAPDQSLIAEFTAIFLDSCYSTYQPGKNSRKTSRVNSVDPSLLGRRGSYFSSVEKPTMVDGLMEKLARLSEE